MRKTLTSVLELFRVLHERRSALQPDFKECLKIFYTLGRKKGLTARASRRADGSIRAVYLVTRRRGRLRFGAHKLRLFSHIKGAINSGLIYKVARDYVRVEDWTAADRTRRGLNRRAAFVAFLLRDLRLALANKFSPAAAVLDRARVHEIVTQTPYLSSDDMPAMLGAVVYDRLLSELERKILDVAERWKTAMKGLPFEPLIRWRDTGPLRLTWAYVDRYHGAQGELQVRSHDIPGGVTDRWLRARHLEGGAARRKAILAYAVELRSLATAYSRLLVYVGRLKAKVHRSLRMDAPDGRVAV